MSDDILERAKAVDPEMLAVLNWGALRDLISELIAEVERLRAALAHELDLRNRHIESLEARIKELEAVYKIFLEANEKTNALEKDSTEKIVAALRLFDDLEAYTKRLEAAFLKSETERKFYTTINGMNSEFDWNGYPECPQNGIHKEWFRQQAREVLEELRHG